MKFSRSLVALLACTSAALAQWPGINLSIVTVQGPTYADQAYASCPEGSLLVGGGYSNPGIGISSSYPVNQSTWFAQGHPIIGDASPATVTAYAVCISNPNNAFSTQITVSQAVGANAQSGTAYAGVSAGYVLSGGGFSTDGYANASYPSRNSWAASLTPNPCCAAVDLSQNGITAYSIGIKSNVAGHTLVSNYVTGSGLGSSVASSGNQVSSGGFFDTTANYTSSSYPSSSDAWTTVSVSSTDTFTSYAVYLSEDNSANNSTNNSTSGPSENGGCSITVTQVVLNSWPGGSQWQVTITNEGSSPVSNVSLYTASSAITNLWSMTNNGNGYYSLPFWITSIAVGGSIQFGYTESDTIQVAFTTLQVLCPGSQSGSGSGSASTSGSASGSSGTSSGTCAGITATQNLRTQWTTDNVPYYLYDITVTNSGSSNANASQVGFFYITFNTQPTASSTNDVQISQTWNLITYATAGNPPHQEFGLSEGTIVYAGSSWTSSGYVVEGSTTNLQLLCPQ